MVKMACIMIRTPNDHMQCNDSVRAVTDMIYMLS